MSAIDELKRLLDERGVEYKKTHDIITGKAVTWTGSVFNWVAFPDEKDYLTANLEQALSFMRIWISEDAHLGESELSAGFEKAEGLRKLDAIESAIAAALGGGECEDEGGVGANGEQVFSCSECGCVLSLYDSDGMNTLCTRFVYDYPRFCPSCGKAVKR